MQTQIILNIDTQTVEFANSYAKEKGQSINELFENYIRLIFLNEQLFKYRTLDVSRFSQKPENLFGLKKRIGKNLIKSSAQYEKVYRLIINLIGNLQMNDKVFIDTNILIYFATDTGVKRDIINQKLADCEFNFISIQVLNEFSNTCFRKGLLQPDEIEFSVMEYADMFNVAILNVETIINALKIKQKYQYSYYDSLIIATAIQNDCNILFSEDMHNQHLIENKLKIINPFK